MKFKLTSKKEKGFTLLEMIVAVGIFGTAAVFAVSSLLSVMSAQKKAATMQGAIDNVRFALEHMSKEIRMGKDYKNLCLGTNPCGDKFEFQKNETNEIIKYERNNDAIEKWVDGILRGPITGPEISIKKMEFYVKGETSATDNFQPRVTIVIKGVAGEGYPRESTELTLQTTISQFRPDQ